MKAAARNFGTPLCALALVAALPARAEEPKTLAPVEVIGTRLKRTDLEPPSPVTVLTREDIRQSGASSLAELLGSLPFAGSAGLRDTEGVNGFAAGASTVSLRGLSSSATLVLVNGRRITPSPYVNPNASQSTIYNLNAIPLSAVERVEVLPSGASAIYGADAVAGVVNIVLRKDYRGAEAGIVYGANGDGDFGNREVNGFAGFGGASGGFGGTIAFNHASRDALRYIDARDLPSDDLTRLFGVNTLSSTRAYPGNYYREAVTGNGVFSAFAGRDARCPSDKVLASGSCAYNPDQTRDLVGAQERNALAASMHLPVDRDLTLFSEFGLAQVKSRYTGFVPFVSETGETWFAGDGSRRFFRFMLPASHPDNPAAVPVAVRYRFHDVGPFTRSVDTDTARLLLGAKGRAGAWEWESGLQHMRIGIDDRQRGNLYVPALQAAIAGGGYRPFGNNAAETIAAIAPEERTRSRAATTSVDLKGNRELVELAGGPLALVAGMELRRETLTATPDARTANGDFMNSGSALADGRRHVGSLFAELSAPLLKELETQFAVRHDRYSDYGSSTNPQLGAKWKPVEAFALRGAFGSGFRAPSLSTIGTSSVQAVANAMRDPRRCGRPGASANDCNFPVSAFIQGNPALQPEKSHSGSLGIILSPHKDVDVSLDYFRISRTGEIGTLSARTLLANEAQYPGAVIRNPNPASWLPGVANSGPVQSVISQYRNFGRTEVRGIDGDAVVRTSLGGWGKFTTRFSGSYLLSYKNKVFLDDPATEYKGGVEKPRFRGSLSGTWNYRAYTVTARVNHVSGWRYGDSDVPCYSGNPGYLARHDCRIKPWTTIDLNLAYSGIRNLDLGFGIRNLQDKAAPLDPDSATTLGYNSTFHNPYGRYFRFWLNYKFM